MLAVAVHTGARSVSGIDPAEFPYGPLGLNSLSWVVAKELRLFEKNGLNVEMVYVGASAVIVQSMLSGAADVAGFGGPAVVTNVLRGGDIIQVAAMAPYFTQSLLVRSDLRGIFAARAAAFCLKASSHGNHLPPFIAIPSYA